MATLTRWASKVLVIFLYVVTLQNRARGATITQLESLVNGGLAELTELDLSGKGLFGPIPAELGNYTNLTRINFKDNALSGPIPLELAQLSNLSVIRFGFNFLSGPIPTKLCTLPRLTYFSLHNNELSGAIPPELGNVSGLTYLSLSGNNLTGPIPPELGKLVSLTSLYLSDNKLSGPIPPGLGALANLTVLTLSQNQLTGSVPSGLLKFGDETFADNPGLCFPPEKCNASSFPPPPVTSAALQLSPISSPPLPAVAPTSSSTARTAVILIVVAGAVIVLVGSSALLWRWRKRKRRQQRSESEKGAALDNSDPLPSSLGAKLYPLEELRNGTCNYSDTRVIGRGAFGVVYRAVLEDGTVVAVKQLQHETQLSERTWLAEVEALGNVRHRNLVPLLGVCAQFDERLLVFEFYPGGNLHARLHEEARVLAWEDRARIARDVSRGLTYLHHDIRPPMLHRDIKPANILLASKAGPLEASIADFGLAHLMRNGHESTLVKGTVPYMAPEYLHGGPSFLTPKCDVYSFGMLLLELVSGRPVVEHRLDGAAVSLLKVATELTRVGRVLDLVDARLSSDYDQCEAQQLIHVALSCLRKDPLERPTMERIQTQLVGKRLWPLEAVDLLTQDAWELSPNSLGVDGRFSDESSLLHESGGTMLVASQFLEPR